MRTTKASRGVTLLSSSCFAEELHPRIPRVHIARHQFDGLGTADDAERAVFLRSLELGHGLGVDAIAHRHHVGEGNRFLERVGVGAPEQPVSAQAQTKR